MSGGPENLRLTDRPEAFLEPLIEHSQARVLNRGESINALKRSIYVGRIAPGRASIGLAANARR